MQCKGSKSNNQHEGHGDGEREFDSCNDKKAIHEGSFAEKMSSRYQCPLVHCNLSIKIYSECEEAQTC